MPPRSFKGAPASAGNISRSSSTTRATENFAIVTKCAFSEPLPTTIGGIKKETARREAKLLARRRREPASLRLLSSPSAKTAAFVTAVSGRTAVSTNNPRSASEHSAPASGQAAVSNNDPQSASEHSESTIAISMADIGSGDPEFSPEDVARLRSRMVVQIYGELDRASLHSCWTESQGLEGHRAPNTKTTKSSREITTEQAYSEMQLRYLRSGHMAAAEQARLAISGAQLCRQFLETRANRDIGSTKALARLRTGLRRDLRQLTGNKDQLNRVRKFAGVDLMEMRRFYEVAQQFGWMLLSILAHSSGFRAYAASATEATWDLLITLIHDLRGSLEMFAKARGLDWRTALDSAIAGGPALTAEQIGSRYDLEFSHPHEYYLDQDGLPQRITINGRAHRNSDENIYREELYGQYKPERWPRKLPFPTDPTAVWQNCMPPCRKCNQAPCQTCRDLFTNPLVEIFDSSDGRGRGVRALETISAQDAVGEYIGSIEPYVGNPDTVYALRIKPGLCDFGVISSARYGNWTRYVNHSCDSNTHFETSFSGGRYRSYLVADREIQPREEITVDYGAGYWSKDRLCLCRSEKCKYDTEEKAMKVHHPKVRPKQKPRARKRKNRHW